MSLVEIIRRQHEEALLENNVNFNGVTNSHKTLRKYSLWFEDGGKVAYERGHGPRFKVQMNGVKNKVPMHGITLEPVKPKEIGNFDISNYRKLVKPFLSRSAINEAIANVCYKPHTSNINKDSISEAIRNISKYWSPGLDNDYNRDIDIIRFYVMNTSGKLYTPSTIRDIEIQMKDGTVYNDII